MSMGLDTSRHFIFMIQKKKMKCRDVELYLGFFYLEKESPNASTSRHFGSKPLHC